MIRCSAPARYGSFGRFSTQSHISLSVAELKAGLNAFVDLPGKEFSSQIQGLLGGIGGCNLGPYTVQPAC